jgi:ATP-dependent protease Clp ATPase subunit
MAAPLDISCAYCQRSQNEVGKLVPGPGIFMCSDCVGDALASLVQESPSHTDRLLSSQNPNAALLYCAVCGKSSQEAKRLLEKNSFCVCSDCLKAALDVLLDEEQPFNGSVKF